MPERQRQVPSIAGRDDPATPFGTPIAPLETGAIAAIIPGANTPMHDADRLFMVILTAEPICSTGQGG
jgi:hypothetical protein